MNGWLWVAIGSALGGMARYGVSTLVARVWGGAFPWATIAINVAGSLMIGAFAALSQQGGRLAASNDLRLFVMVGLCGGFTTFSSFSLQTLELAQFGAWPAALANIGLSVTLCLLAVAAGHLLVTRIGL